jgi:hypothetical protein
MQKKYGFNDNEIYELHIKKCIVPKSKEYFIVEMSTLSNKVPNADNRQ